MGGSSGLLDVVRAGEGGRLVEHLAESELVLVHAGNLRVRGLQRKKNKNGVSIDNALHKFVDHRFVP